MVVVVDSCYMLMGIISKESNLSGSSTVKFFVSILPLFFFHLSNNFEFKKINPSNSDLIHNCYNINIFQIGPFSFLFNCFLG